MRVIFAVLLAFIAGVAGTIWFYSGGGRIIAWGSELGPARVVTVAAPTPAAAPQRLPNAPRPANPVRTVEEEGKPTALPPPETKAPPASAAKEPVVPADALNILGVVIVWPK